VVVIDTETTGLYSSDRIVEISIVTLSLDGDVVDIFDTLVQPERDVSATHIHGITASMVASAPTFADVAGDVAVRLDGACLAAHNLAFDHRMLNAEFERVGTTVTTSAGIDTLRATGVRLAEACAAHGIALDGAHRSLVDATATAHLVRAIADLCDVGGPTALSMRPPRLGRVLRREDTAPVELPDPPLIAYLAARLPHSGVAVDMLPYLELVGRAVGDLHLDPTERQQLEALAIALGLNEAHIAQAHRRFVNELIDAAVADDVVTADEYETLVRVAAALGVDQQVVETRTHQLRSVGTSLRIDPDVSVVFTGDHPAIERSTLVAHAEQLGMSVAKGMSKRIDLLVAADPDSNSGKAKKARQYGIPVLGAEAFAASRSGDTIEATGIGLETLKVVTCPDCLATTTVPATTRSQSSKRCDDCVPVR
jgi:DNA polymerase III subunit epsilon